MDVHVLVCVIKQYSITSYARFYCAQKSQISPHTYKDHFNKI